MLKFYCLRKCAVAYRGTNIPDLVKITDNVDQNAKTMDGKNAFHGMGVIVVVTPSLKSIYFIFLIYFVVWNIYRILSFQRCLLSLNNFSVC